ncbi:MAG: glycosyltransferase family 4 protein [Nitrococcus sp.]|nr:glycosyltransferase family 4 protein [Nitrococcus sp.]
MRRVSVWRNRVGSVEAVSERALRLVVVGPVPPPAGGMATQTRQLVRLWQSEGVDAMLLPVNLPYRPAWIGRWRGLRAALRLPYYVAALWRAAGQASCFHVMANSGWSWFLFAVPALAVARLRRRSIVVNYRGGQAGVFLRRFGTLVRPTLRCASVLVVPSGFLQSVFGEHGLQSQTIPNVVDVDSFRWREPDSAMPEAPHVVITRNLERIYDIPTALRAFGRLCRRFPHARLTIAGTGPEREVLYALTRELGLSERVCFAGRLDREQIAALYAKADVMLNTSLIDNMPNALLEALACGVPIVTTAAGGIPWMVTDGETALLVPESDPGAAAEALQRVLEDRALASRLALRGRAVAESCTWPAVRRQWAMLYDRIGGGSV